MTAIEKVKAAEQRILACIHGTTADIMCPFCGLLNSPKNELLCCENLADVVNTVLNHVELKDNMELVARVMDRAAAMDAHQRKVVLN